MQIAINTWLTLKSPQRLGLRFYLTNSLLIFSRYRRVYFEIINHYVFRFSLEEV